MRTMPESHPQGLIEPRLLVPQISTFRLISHNIGTAVYAATTNSTPTLTPGDENIWIYFTHDYLALAGWHLSSALCPTTRPATVSSATCFAGSAEITSKLERRVVITETGSGASPSTSRTAAARQRLAVCARQRFAPRTWSFTSSSTTLLDRGHQSRTVSSLLKL